jgi:uncharacterized protein YjbI with pentapeptide repeats
LTEAYFGHANLEQANLTDSIVNRAYFGQADVKETDFSSAKNLDPMQLRLARNFELAILAKDDAQNTGQLLSA